MHEGQSLGKKMLRLSVVSLENSGPCGPRQSLIRNLPLLVPLALALIPIWGLFLALLLGLPLLALEIYLIFKLDSGHRLGDVMADTSVVGYD